MFQLEKLHPIVFQLELLSVYEKLSLSISNGTEFLAQNWQIREIQPYGVHENSITFTVLVTISSNIQKRKREKLLLVLPWPSEDPDDPTVGCKFQGSGGMCTGLKEKLGKDMTKMYILTQILWISYDNFFLFKPQMRYGLTRQCKNIRSLKYLNHYI